MALYTEPSPSTVSTLPVSCALTICLSRALSSGQRTISLALISAPEMTPTTRVMSTRVGIEVRPHQFGQFISVPLDLFGAGGA